jgi:hypothetical protein
LHEGEANVVHRTRAERARSRAQTTQGLAASAEFREQVITGDIPKEQGHGDGHGCGFYPLAGLFCAASELTRLGPRGSSMSCGLVTAQFRVLIRKRVLERLRKPGGFNSFAL